MSYVTKLFQGPVFSGSSFDTLAGCKNADYCLPDFKNYSWW